VNVVVPENTGHCVLFDSVQTHREYTLKYWVTFALTDRALLDAAILLSACRSLLDSGSEDKHLGQLVLYYKQRSLGALRQAMTKSSAVDSWAVAMAFALAFDEVEFPRCISHAANRRQVACQDYGVAQQHLGGIYAMARASGGLRHLGLTKMLEEMYRKFVTRAVEGEGPRSVLCRHFNLGA
jgi:hypothetical protein